MFSKIDGIKVSGVAAAVSEKWDSVQEVSTDRDEGNIKRFIKKTGVEGHYSASQRQTTSDFCYAAAQALLKHKQIPPEEVGVLVFVTQTSDYRIPATACVLAHRLGLAKSCIAFDVNLGCSGYVYGLDIAASVMRTCEARYGLMLAGDICAREFSAKHQHRAAHSSTLLFGDAGSATLLEKSGEDSLQVAMGHGWRWLSGDHRRRIWDGAIPIAPPGRGNDAQMDEIAVFNFATSEAPAQLNEYMARLQKTEKDYDCLVLHQANLMIMKQIAKKTGFPLEKMPISMRRFANTSSASIPVTLVDLYGENQERRKFVRCAVALALVCPGEAWSYAWIHEIYFRWCIQTSILGTVLTWKIWKETKEEQAMTEQEKISLIEETLELDEGTLTADTVLADVDEYDSMAKLSLIVMMDDEFGAKLTGDMIKSFVTVADILKVMQ